MDRRLGEDQIIVFGHSGIHLGNGSGERPSSRHPFIREKRGKMEEGEKAEILGALEAMEHASKRVGSEEKELVSEFRALLHRSSITKRSLGKIRNLLGKTIFTHARDKNPDLEKYFKRKVLKKIELKAAKQGIKMNLSDDKLYFICLFGALMAAVANIDGHFNELEKNALKKVRPKKMP